jgi:Lon protease-like protein
VNDADVMPMFPLGSVLFPYASLPLHVFEPRYRIMVRKVMRAHREFGVVLIERGQEVGGGDARFDIGTVARIVQAQEFPDGRYALTTVGTRRIRVVRWLDDDPFPRAEIVEHDDEPEPDDRGALDRVVEGLRVITELVRRIDPRVAEPPELAADPLRASYEAAAIAPIGPLDAQRVLEAAGAVTRLTLLDALLGERSVALRAHLGDE